MSRKSSIHFKPVSNVRFAVSHSERTDLSEPSYLLPREHQLDNIIVAGSLSENDLAALFIQQKEGMTGQAKARGSSPFWEGVVVLPNTDGQEQSANLQVWKKAYEEETGHKVLHMSVHLDEGYIDTNGAPQYNPHAHVIVSRMDSKSRVVSLDRKQLAKVQDLTAETLQMERGSTLAERAGKRGRKHISHQEFRQLADEKRLELDKPKSKLINLQKLSKEWSDTDLSKIKELEKRLAAAQIQIDQQTAQIASLNENYRLDREAMKASGKATQAEYQALKKERDAAVAELKISNEKVDEMEKRIDDQDKELDEVKAKYAAMAKAYTAHVEAGLPWIDFVPGTTYAPLPSPTNNLTPSSMPQKATRQAQEALKQPEPPIPSPKPSKSLVERLGQSLKAMLDWIKFIGAEQEPVTESSQHIGPVKHMDDLHCVQKTGRRYAVHKLADLDKVPQLDDPKMVIKYKAGQGTVESSGLGIRR